jgi:hypothetical protein
LISEHRPVEQGVSGFASPLPHCSAFLVAQFHERLQGRPDFGAIWLAYMDDVFEPLWGDTAGGEHREAGCYGLHD